LLLRVTAGVTWSLAALLRRWLTIRQRTSVPQVRTLLVFWSCCTTFGCWSQMLLVRGAFTARLLLLAAAQAHRRAVDAAAADGALQPRSPGTGSLHRCCVHRCLHRPAGGCAIACRRSCLTCGRRPRVEGLHATPRLTLSRTHRAYLDAFSFLWAFKTGSIKSPS